MNPDIIGWAASAVLLATLVRQILKQALNAKTKDGAAAGAGTNGVAGGLSTGAPVQPVAASPLGGELHKE